MRFLKKILKKPFIMRGLAFLISCYIQFVFKSSKWKWINQDIIDRLIAEKTPWIVCFWHNRLLMMSANWTGPQNKMHMLISAHRDGLLIAETMKYFGILTVSGSSTKGGLQALRHLIRLLKKGDCIGITPDGPRGPRFKARGGIVQVAKLAGCPIVPVSYSTTRRKVLNSWDRFVFAFPFSKGVFIAGEPIYVPASATAEESKEVLLTIETKLKYISDHADQLCGHAPISEDKGK